MCFLKATELIYNIDIFSYNNVWNPATVITLMYKIYHSAFLGILSLREATESCFSYASSICWNPQGPSIQSVA